MNPKRKRALLLCFCAIVCFGLAAMGPAKNHRTGKTCQEVLALEWFKYICVDWSPSFDKDFTDEEKDQLKYTLNMSDIDLLYRDEEVVVYCETSNFNYLPLQRADIILWEYRDGESTQLFSSSAIFWNIQVIEDERIVELEIDGEEKHIIQY